MTSTGSSCGDEFLGEFVRSAGGAHLAGNVEGVVGEALDRRGDGIADRLDCGESEARVDGSVALGVIASALGVALGFVLADSLIGLLLTLVMLKIHLGFLARRVYDLPWRLDEHSAHVR